MTDRRAIRHGLITLMVASAGAISASHSNPAMLIVTVLVVVVGSFISALASSMETEK